jgi:dienelactone hydrolase
MSRLGSSLRRSQTVRRVPRTRGLLSLLAAVLLVLLVAGCSIARPGGTGTIRYRDPIFTAVTKTADIQYGSAVPQGATTAIPLKLDLYRPTGDTQTKRPAVVWVHGGGYCCGDKGGGPAADLAQKFAKLGYVTVSINYRLISTGCTGSNITPACYQAATDAQHDAQAAVRFLRANATAYGIDPTRIGIGGESAGAITATAVGVHSEDPGTSGNAGYSSQVGGFSSISGGLPGGLYAGAGDAPGVLFHGTADSVVPYQWSVDTASALLKAKSLAFLETLDGAGHVPYDQYGQQFYEQSDYFFYDVLDLGHAAGQPAAARRAADTLQRKMSARYPRLAHRVHQRLRPARR